MTLRSLALACLLLVPLALQAAPVRKDQVEADLIAERTALVPGQDNWVALRLRPDPEWHVYWRNPGDSGIATSLRWTLPSGVEAGDIHWPYPHRHSLGELTNYGYGEDTLHLVPIRLAAGTRGPVRLQANAKWLVCKDICIPGSADLSLELPVATAATADAAWQDAFAGARAQLPQPARDWPAQFQVAGDSLSLQVQGAALAGAETIEFYPYANDLVAHAAPQRLQREGAEGLRLSQAASPYFVEPPATVEGVLVLTRSGRTQAWEIAAQPGSVEPVAAAEARPAPPAAAPDHGDSQPPGLALVLLFALAGGLILNLMPCVFPVLSLKALSLARGGNLAEQRRQTFAYTAGVVLSCVAAAGAMIGLRQAGESIGWGFQLQSPAFVGLMAYLLFALGLSLSGAVEFGTRLMNLGGSLAQRPGLGGAFFTGVLAVVVASPCTAPFMGTALGYAMTQPASVAILVFAMLGLGLALPFLLIGLVPALARRLPRPGAWMETFKQAMAFPLYLSVAWLLWVLARQAGADGLAQVLVGLVLLAFALWLWSRRGLVVSLLKLLALAAALALLLRMPAVDPSAPPGVLPAASEAWSPARVAELRAEGRTVFVDFTADWCLSCKVNERVALQSARVQETFRQRDVVMLVGDWTRGDPAITAELARFGRNGVPLYLVYPKGGEPQVLPQLLTPDIVIDALDPAP